MATRPKAVIESRNGEKLSPITIAKNVLTDDGQNLHDILSDRKEDMMTPTIENSSSMFKVGQGDNVDYSSNVVNGAYESMVLKGKTMVNIHKSATYSLSRKNEGWYENLVAETNRISFEVTDTSTDGWKYLNLGKLNLDMLKSNTKYLVYFGVANFPHNLGVRFMNGNATDKISNEAMVAQGSNWAILTTSSEIIKSEQVLYVTFTNVLGKVEVGNVMIFEYQEGMENWDIPYFEGMASCKMPILKSVGKNLFDHNNFIPCNKTDAYVGYENGYVVANINVESTHFFYKADLSKMPRGIYSIIDRHEGENSYLGIQLTRKDGTKTWGKKQFDNDGSYAELGLYMQSTTSAPSLKVKAKIMLIMGDNTTTPHEDHKSSILSLPKEVVLRSLPNGVCDTLNVETGEYTQRIGEYTYNGDNTVKQHYVSNNNHGQPFFTIEVSSLGRKESTNGISDTLPHESIYSTVRQTKNAFCVNLGGNTAIRLYIDGLTTTEQYRNYFRNVPITIQYELTTPIVSTVDIQGFPYAYENGHVQLSSGSIEQSLTPKVEYSVVTNRNGQIRSNQKMVERHQKQLDRLQAMILTNLVNTQYEQALTNLKYDLKNVREEVK